MAKKTDLYTFDEMEEWGRREEAFKLRCQELSLRVTPQRLEVFKALAMSRAHPSAEIIFDSVRKILPNISLDTVYRTLASLEQAGLVCRVGGGSKARFDAPAQPHCHFVCMQCNTVYDIYAAGAEKVSPYIRRVSHFGEVKQVDLQYRGICRRCLAAGSSKR